MVKYKNIKWNDKQVSMDGALSDSENYRAIVVDRGDYSCIVEGFSREACEKPLLHSEELTYLIKGARSLTFKLNNGKKIRDKEALAWY